MWLTLYNGNDLCLVLKRGKKKKKNYVRVRKVRSCFSSVFQ